MNITAEEMGDFISECIGVTAVVASESDFEALEKTVREANFVREWIVRQMAPVKPVHMVEFVLRRCLALCGGDPSPAALPAPQARASAHNRKGGK